MEMIKNIKFLENGSIEITTDSQLTNDPILYVNTYDVSKFAHTDMLPIASLVGIILELEERITELENKQ